MCFMLYIWKKLYHSRGTCRQVLEVFVVFVFSPCRWTLANLSYASESFACSMNIDLT